MNSIVPINRLTCTLWLLPVYFAFFRSDATVCFWCAAGTYSVVSGSSEVNDYFLQSNM